MREAIGSGLCLSAPEQQQLKALIAQRGELGLARDASISRTTLARAAAGLQLRRASVVLLRQVLAASGSEA